MGRYGKPTHYIPVQFHGVRLVCFLSSLIVALIMVFFCVQLKTDGYKLPWTFLFTMAASVLTVIALTVTTSTILFFKKTLFPILNLIGNVLLLALWVAGFGLLTNNIYGTLGHSCSRDNWLRYEGMMICHTYKALYAFSVIALASQGAQIVMDWRARNHQKTTGKYDAMRDPLTGEKTEDMLQLTKRNSSTDASSSLGQMRDEHVGWRPGQKSKASSLAMHDYASPHERSSQEYARGQAKEPMRAQQFANGSMPDTQYDPGDMGTYRPQYRDS